MEVPELIKNASESTVTTLSHLVDDVKDRLDDVKDRIDSGLAHRHAPPPKKQHVALKTMVLLALLGAAVAIVAKRLASKGQGGERFTEAKADRPPTDDEARAAERWAADVDVPRVGKHYEEMADRGAKVAGEGQIDSVKTN